MRRFATVCVCLALSAACLAQPAPPPPEDRPAVDGERLRERLELRLADLDEERARIQGALAKLEGGAPPLEAIRTLRSEGMDGPGPGGWGDGPRGEHRDGRRPDGDAPLTDEERARVMEFIENENPSMAARIRDLKEDRPEVAQRMLERATPRIRELMRLQERNPELFDLRTRAMRVGLDIRRSAIAAHRLVEAEGEDSPAAAEKMADVERLVRERADLEVAIKRAELDEFERRIERLRSELERASDDREALIERELDRVRQRILEEEAPRARRPRP